MQLQAGVPPTLPAPPPTQKPKEEVVVPPPPPQEVGPWRLSIVDVVFQPKTVRIHLKLENIESSGETRKVAEFWISHNSYIAVRGQQFKVAEIGIEEQNVPPGAWIENRLSFSAPEGLDQEASFAFVLKWTGRNGDRFTAWQDVIFRIVPKAFVKKAAAPQQ